MLEDRELVGTPAHLSFMRTHRLLRPIARQARHQAFSDKPTSDYRGLRPAWCYVDETFIELDHATPQLGPIPRFVE